MSIPPRIFLILDIFNVLALFRVQWRSRIQDICFHFHPNSITSLFHQTNRQLLHQRYGTVAAVMKESHPWINWLLLRIYSSASSLKAHFITNKEIQLKYARWKYICNNSNFDVVVPLPLDAFEHFQLLPAIVSLHPGLSRWSPILGDEGHPRKTVRKLAPHTHSSMNQLQFFPTQFSRLPVHVATRF